MDHLLAGMERAEDYFEALGVAYDPEVLAATRLGVLRAFGVAIADLDARAGAAGPERLRAYADALRRAYALYARAREVAPAAGDAAPRPAGGGCAGCGSAGARGR